MLDEALLLHRDEACRPVTLLAEDELDAWLARQPPLVATWVRGNAFRPERQRLLLIPGDRGDVAQALLGIGRRESGGLSPWLVAGLPERLPQGRWYLSNALAPGEATDATLGWLLGRYRFDRYKRRDSAARTVALVVPTGADVELAQRLARADRLARDLVNTPAADLGPEALAAEAAAVASRCQARCIQIVGEQLLERGLHAIHAVGRAAHEAPRLVDLRWGRAGAPKVTLVGKGVCFDTGGLDLKPASGMALMKKDMGGAAVTLALAQAVMEAGLDVELRVLLPIVENSVAGNAYRPGDVLKTRKGLTVEVNNTDAEGRLVLCDALAEADLERPDLLVDLATLTGAARVALGPELPAVFSNRDELAAAACAAGAAVADPLWHLPLWKGYDDELGSKVADVANVAPSAFAGAIFGALFLQRFVGAETPWLHVDLYAWNPKDRPGRPVGGDAQSLRALYRLLVERYGSARQ